MTDMKIMVDDNSLGLTRLTLGTMATNAYILQCQKTGARVLVDAPGEPSFLTDFLKEHPVEYVWLTHNHPDHTGALTAVHQLGIPLGVHARDQGDLSSPPDRFLKHGEKLAIGQLEIEVMHTPGHTPGSLCFLAGSYLLAGDTLFSGGPGRTPSPDAFRSIIASIRDRLLVLPPETVVYPGHGEPTTIRKAKAEYVMFAARPQVQDLYGDVLWSMDDTEDEE